MTMLRSPASPVRFGVYGVRDLGPAAAARLVGRALGIRLDVRVGAVRGTHYRWSDAAGGDVLVQARDVDEDLDDDRAYGSIVYVTALDAAAHAALDGLAALDLLDADLVVVD